MAYKVSKSGRIVKASLPRKLPKEVIEQVEKGNSISQAFLLKASSIIVKSKVAYEL